MRTFGVKVERAHRSHHDVHAHRDRASVHGSATLVDRQDTSLP